MVQYSQRRRIKTEEKAEVVAYVWGEEFIQFDAALAILPRKILNNIMNLHFFFNHPWCNSSYNSSRSCKTASAPRNWIHSPPPNSSDDLCLSTIFILLLWVQYIYCTVKCTQTTHTHSNSQYCRQELWCCFHYGILGQTLAQLMTTMGGPSLL